MFSAGGLYPILLIIGAIVVCAAMELLSLAIVDKAARKTVDANPGFKGKGQKAA